MSAVEIATREAGEGVLRMTVTIAADEMAERIRKAAIMVAFRSEIAPDPAIAPQEAVERKLGCDEAQARIAEQVMKDAVPFALTQERIDIVGSPTFVSAHQASAGKPFEFIMECVPVPRFELPSYAPVSITVPPARVAGDAVAERIAAIAEQHATWEADSEKRAVRAGDVVELSMETEKNGERVAGLCRKSNRYTVGSFAMPDAFDEAVEGMEAGQSREVVYEGPSFETDGAGNPIMEEYRSRITVKRILKKAVPAVSDSWVAATVPGCATVAELEDRVRGSLEEEARSQQAKQVEFLAASELAKRFDARIPDAVYEAAMDEAKREFAAKLAEEDTTLEDFLAQGNVDEQQLTVSLMMQVREQLVHQFSLNALAEHYGLSVDDSDMEAFFESIAPGRAMQARLDFERSGRLFAAQRAALRLKANRRLAAEAIIDELDGEGIG